MTLSPGHPMKLSLLQVTPAPAGDTESGEMPYAPAGHLSSSAGDTSTESLSPARLI